MSNVDKIRDAEAQVEQLQDALGSVQSGLERAEQVAVAAEEAKERSDQWLKGVAALAALLIVVLVVSRRRSGD